MSKEISAANTMKAIDGNTAAAHAAYAFSDNAMIYPISQVDKHDQRFPTASNARIGHHSKSVPISSTNTAIGIHGFAELQIIHNTNGFDNNEFDTIDIPVEGAPSQTKFSVNPTRLEVSSWFVYPIRTRLEMMP